MEAGSPLQGLKAFDLEQPRYEGAPTHPSHATGLIYLLHRRHELDLGERRTSASGVIISPEHSGTHIDALCHQAEQLEMFGGVVAGPGTQTSTGFKELGVETIPPLVSRGVLLDVAGHAGVERLPDLYAITDQELAQTAADHGLTIADGDVVLIRTGNGALWSDPPRYLKGAGLATAASQWLANHRVAAVGADNMALDVIGYVDPDMGVSLPGHVILLVRAGIYIIENLYLEGLAANRIYDFTFVCLPLKIRGATGSPVRPVALIQRS
jgi:kynurenine formamidase